MRDDKKLELVADLPNKLTGIPSKDRIWLKRSKRASVKLPDSHLSVYDYIYECNKNNLDDVALEYDPLIDYSSTKITYRKLFKMIETTTMAYMELGVKKGDIVTVCLPSFVENIVNFYALNRLGAIANQIHPLASKDEVKFYLEEAESKIFVSYDGNFDNFKDVIEELNIENVIMVDATNLVSTKNKVMILYDKYKKLRKEKNISLMSFIKEVSKTKTYPSSRYISFKDFMNLGKHNKEIIVNSFNDACSLTHTSGTTGKSKGVLSSNYGFNEMVRQIAEETPVLERGDKELLVLPPYPLYVLCNNVHMCLARGINIVVVPKVDYQNIHKYFMKHKITAVQGIPSTVMSMLNDKGFKENNVDLSAIKFIVAGGGALASETLKKANNFLHKHNCKYNVTVGYGMSEMGSCAVCTFDENDEFGTVGRPLNDTNIKIVNPETKEEVGYNTAGEIWLSGPCRMIGYYKNEEATDKLFGKEYDKEGNEIVWVRTGDIGMITPTGNLKYIGRDKRITMIVDIKTNTVSKVSNDYVEDILIGNYGTAVIPNCVVVSVPNEETLNALKAYVVVKDSPADYSEIVTEMNKKCEEILRDNSRPIEYVFVDKIPETKAGKKDFVLVQEFEEGKKKDGIKVKTRIKVKKDNL